MEEVCRSRGFCLMKVYRFLQLTEAYKKKFTIELVRNYNVIYRIYYMN